MNDTVVIYDRIRENLSKYSSSTIDDVSNTSINETLSRTIITSVTTLLALLSIYILGGEILRGFSFAMILGVVIGTYSSIFVASPILKFLKVSYKTLEKEEEKICNTLANGLTTVCVDNPWLLPYIQKQLKGEN